MRGMNADLNMTLAMATIFMGLWLYWSLTEQGVGTAVTFFGERSRRRVVGHVLGNVLLCAVEVVSIGVRRWRNLRLYGNVFAGENILETVMAMAACILAGWPCCRFTAGDSASAGTGFCTLCAVFTAHAGEARRHALNTGPQSVEALGTTEQRKYMPEMLAAAALKPPPRR